ncbi:MAG TPA: nicotinate-nicotinamide nucleotide adenylyltransferase [Acidobacteriota bacterium]|nr:nicotinate-nicotinamide nucleotide adenylyltransferase [Acidobacteriota bacterium]
MTVAEHKGIKIALFGGGFDPPHKGHVAFCRALAGSGLFDRVWVLPTFRHPFGKGAAAFEDRLQMCRLAFSELSDRVEVRDDEVHVGGDGYTVELIRWLQERHLQYDFSLVLGSDNYEVRTRWKDFDEIERLVDVRFFGRKGWEELNRKLHIPAPFPRVSSEEIRGRIAEGKMPRNKLPRAVAAYIKEKGLYKEPGVGKKRTAADCRGRETGS